MKTVIALSGGQDSTTCLLDLAINQQYGDDIYPVFFDYGQRHKIELLSANEICKMLGLRDPYVIPVEALNKMGGAALTNRAIEVNTDATGTGNVFAEKHGLPSTFVPGRNMVFLGLAGAYAAQVGATDIVTGVCQADDAGYPDCRSEFITAMERAVNEALGVEGTPDTIKIQAPLLYKTKADTWAMADSIEGGLRIIIDKTHTCYEGDHETKNEWGYGCGKCGACVERANGYKVFADRKAGIADAP